MQDRLLRAKEYVRSHHPELADVEPAEAQPAPGIAVFTFRKDFSTPDGARLSKVVRVTVAEDGTIVRATVSK